MVGMLLQEGHDIVGVKAGLPLLKHHLNCLHTTANRVMGSGLLLSQRPESVFVILIIFGSPIGQE